MNDLKTMAAGRRVECGADRSVSPWEGGRESLGASLLYQHVQVMAGA